MAGGSHDLVLGRYRLESPLGQGGFGQIFTGLQVSLHREIAIKTIKPNMLNADFIRERFRREALLAASINHPNVVTIHDFGVDCDGDLVLVMELLKGANLLQELRLRPKPSLEQVARRVRQAANGLGAAHDIGIIHRDIKPSNIFLIHPGKDTEFVKIIDFGIVRATDQAKSIIDSDQDITGSDLFLGTPDYAAPEMILGDPIDGRADQYALALVALLMLTGEKGFQSAKSPWDLLERASRRPKTLENEHLTPAIRRVLYRALTPEPSGRYADIREFAADFVQAATGNGALQDDLDKTSLILGLGDIHDSESFDDFQIQADHENCEPVREHKSKWGRFKWTLGFTAILTATAVFAGFMLFDDSTKADQPFDNKVKQSIVVETASSPHESQAISPAVEESELAAAQQATGEQSEEETPPSKPTKPTVAPSIQPKRAQAIASKKPSETAFYSFNASPWAEIVVNGTSYGVTPVSNVKVKGGENRITFKHPTLGSKSFRHTIQAGEYENFSMDFTRRGRP